MLFLDQSFSDPASNLALDEALLHYAEEGLGGEVLRVWESPIYFIVLGYSSKWKNEIRPEAVEQIPVLRRKSGGATVLQGPGCLNFSLILEAPKNSGIRSDTAHIMQKNRLAAENWTLDGKIEIQGISDLTWNGRKFSGNAMRRGKKYFLFHGTFLYQFELPEITRHLGSPDREPAYRQKRSHADFLINIPIKKKEIVQTLRQTWNAKSTFEQKLELEKLKADFYSNQEWNLKF